MCAIFLLVMIVSGNIDIQSPDILAKQSEAKRAH